MARFEVGNKGGPGRPRRQTESAYLSVLMSACDLDRWKAICERAVIDAEDGNDKARAWLASYLVGAPGATAPTPMAVIVEDLLQVDPALSQAAGRLADSEIRRAQFPRLHDGDAAEEAILAEAQAAILAAQKA